MKYNSHGHILDFECVPERFIPFISKRLLKDKEHLERWVKILRNANPFQDNDALDKYAKFISTMGMTQENILDKWIAQYPHEMTFNVLAMDLRWMCAGKVQKPYLQQLNELLDIQTRKPIMISVMIDPRADDLGEIYNWCVKNAENISGLKLYPLVGYTVNDPRLSPFYELARKHKWGIIVHGTPHNAVHCRSRKEVCNTMPRDFEGFKRAYTLKNKCGNYAHPYHIIKAAEANPEVNYCIAHFHPEWQGIIIDAMNRLPNFYSDISFTYNEPKEQHELYRLITRYPILKMRLLFGDDMYMIESEDISNGFTELEKHIGEMIYNKLTIDNPKRFFAL